MFIASMRTFLVRFAGAVVLCLLAAGCVSSPAPEQQMAGASPAARAQFEDLELLPYLPAPENTNRGRDVPVAENDLLQVDVFQVDKLDKAVRVDSGGRISLPLIGVVEAAGKTVPELEAAIEAKYGANYLQHPDVTVFVEESAGQQVTVDGAVNKPGIYPVTSTSTLLEVLAQAGGFREIADESKLYVFRRVGGRDVVASYDVKNIREGKRSDPPIYGGDKLVSFPSGSKVAMRNLKQALGMASSVGRFVVP